jgi:hypothetical protein
VNEEEPYEIYLCKDLTGIIKGISDKIGTFCYHRLCDLGASNIALPFTLYLEIKPSIDPIQM